MNDEAAESRGPATTGAGPSQDASAPSPTPATPEAATAATPPADVPPAWTPPEPDAAVADDPLPPPDAASPPPPPPPPGSGQVPPAAPPPWFGAADGAGMPFLRDKLIRPAKGRYVAGVCAALGRATNTDPVLWRVLLAVLTFFSGVGVLIYLIGWLVIPSEGDAASPIESLLGRGRSGMTPLSVVLLGGAAVLTFAFIVHGGFRATLLTAAVLVGAALLVRRNAGMPAGATAQPAGAAPPDTGSAAFPGTPGAAEPTMAFGASAPPAGGTAPTTGDPATATASATEPLTEPLPPAAPYTTAEPGYPPAAPSYSPASDYAPAPSYSQGPSNPPPQFGPPPGGYRPPFAPHGPWAAAPEPPYGTTQPRPKPAKAPKKPRERSKLGRITFFALIVVLGTLALIDTAGASVSISGYFAAALATIALGLLVGAWLGRARGLIALALLATFGLAVSSGTEQWGSGIGSNTFRPKTIDAVGDRYDFTLGNATLDLRAVSFTKAQQSTMVVMRYGQLKILLPDNVDTTASIDMQSGRATVFGKEWDGRNVGSQEITDLGADGAGGGTLHLTIQMKAGNVEVTR